MQTSSLAGLVGPLAGSFRIASLHGRVGIDRSSDMEHLVLEVKNNIGVARRCVISEECAAAPLHFSQQNRSRAVRPPAGTNTRRLRRHAPPSQNQARNPRNLRWATFYLIAGSCRTAIRNFGSCSDGFSGKGASRQGTEFPMTPSDGEVDVGSREMRRADASTSIL